MLPETQIAMVAAFGGFVLKIFLGFCICWAISKIVVSPRRKFLVWFTFLSIAGGYWLFLVVSFIPQAGPELALPVHAVASSEPLAKWQLPASWAYPVMLIERVVGGLYLFALGYFLAARVKKQLRLRWVLRFAYKAPDRIESMFRSIAMDCGVEEIQLLVLSGIYSPATFGWIHPVVLLPPLCLEQDESELADIFRHELQHVARHDFFFQNVAGLCRTLLFFHPALWYAMRRMELESELACDLAVVRNFPERRATYAECLVRFARLHAAQDPTPWDLDFAGSALQLKVRVRSVLTETVKLPAWLLGLRTSVGVLLFAAFLYITPSLSVVLSYANRATRQPVITSLIRSRAYTRPRRRSPIRSQQRENLVRSLETPVSAVTAPAGPSEASLEPAPKETHLPDTTASGEPVPTLQQRGAGGARTTERPARAAVILISNPPSVKAGGPGASRARSFGSAFMTGASEAIRFAGSHGKEIR